MFYVFKRILAVIPVLGIVAVIVFLLLHLSPGDPAALIAGDTASSADVERVRHLLGLDRPLLEQFFSWLWRLLQGDLGVSVFTGLPVTTMIGQRIEPTLWLTFLTITFAVVLAVPMGIVAAWKAGTWIDRTLMALAVMAFSLPVFLIGYLFIFGFSIKLAWLPVQGFHSLREGFGPFIKHLILPALSGGLVYMALIARMTRAAMQEVLQADYIRSARAIGLGEGGGVRLVDAHLRERLAEVSHLEGRAREAVHTHHAEIVISDEIERISGRHRAGLSHRRTH